VRPERRPQDAAVRPAAEYTWCDLAWGKEQPGPSALCPRAHQIRPNDASGRRERLRATGVLDHLDNLFGAVLLSHADRVHMPF
jgi:hypothetical protein